MPESINEKSKDVTSARESGTRENPGTAGKHAGGGKAPTEPKVVSGDTKPKK